MSKARFRTQVSETLVVCSIAGIVSVFASVPSKAEEQVQPPPYEIAGLNIVTVNVVWDDAAVRKALPRGIEPVKGMTGGINIYNTERGYVVGPYSAAYFWVDIEGFDSPEGIKGRWMLAGVYGPGPKTTAAFQANGFPVRSGTSRFESIADGKRAIGTVSGQDFVTAEIKSVPGSCEAGSVLLNYISMSPQAKQLVVTHIPVVGDFCKADTVSAKITAAPGDPFAAFTIAKVVGMSEGKNISVAITAPQPAEK
jgi:hypothetical protein